MPVNPCHPIHATPWRWRERCAMKHRPAMRCAARGDAHRLCLDTRRSAWFPTMTSTPTYIDPDKWFGGEFSPAFPRVGHRGDSADSGQPAAPDVPQLWPRGRRQRPASQRIRTDVPRPRGHNDHPGHGAGHRRWRPPVVPVTLRIHGGLGQSRRAVLRKSPRRQRARSRDMVAFIGIMGKSGTAGPA